MLNIIKYVLLIICVLLDGATPMGRVFGWRKQIGMVFVIFVLQVPFSTIWSEWLSIVLCASICCSFHVNAMLVERNFLKNIAFIWTVSRCNLMQVNFDMPETFLAVKCHQIIFAKCHQIIFDFLQTHPKNKTWNSNHWKQLQLQGHQRFYGFDGLDYICGWTIVLSSWQTNLMLHCVAFPMLTYCKLQQLPWTWIDASVVRYYAEMLRCCAGGHCSIRQWLAIAAGHMCDMWVLIPSCDALKDFPKHFLQLSQVKWRFWTAKCLTNCVSKLAGLATGRSAATWGK